MATHFAYNIGRGAAILVDKWNAAPENRPVAGIDTNSDPRDRGELVLRGLGLQRLHGPRREPEQPPAGPDLRQLAADAVLLRASERRPGPQPQQYPYQELVYGCMAHPPTVQGQPLWGAIDATLPDLNNPYWRTPLDLANFQAPFADGHPFAEAGAPR